MVNIRNTRNMKKSVIFIMIIISLIIITGIAIVVTKKVRPTFSFSDVDFMIQDKASLIPNLVSIVEEYASNKNEAIEKVEENSLTKIESLIYAEIKNYNNDVTNFNEMVTKFPSNVFDKMLNLEQAVYFLTSEPNSEASNSNTPNVTDYAEILYV